MLCHVNMLSVICVLLNTKFHNTSENFYFEVILSRTIVSYKVTNMTNRYIDFILDLDKEFNFKDLYVLTRTGCSIINQKFVDSMFVPGAVAIQKWNFPFFFGHKRDTGMGLLTKKLMTRPTCTYYFLFSGSPRSWSSKQGHNTEMFLTGQSHFSWYFFPGTKFPFW